MVDYPTYMQTIHGTWLTALGTGITTAVGANPYDGLTGYVPTTDIASMATAITTFTATVAAMNSHTDFDTAYANAAAVVDATILPAAYIAARVAQHSTALDVEINTKIIPRFNAGMRDINAVMTSSFVIGQSIIALDKLDKVDKFEADMQFQADTKRSDLISNAAGEMIRMLLQKTEYRRVIAALTLDQLRMAIAAQSDYQTEVKAIAADHGRWPLEVYKYGANMLAGIGGGVTSSVPVDGNKTARIIGSGLSGAVAGAQIGKGMEGNQSGWGALIGGIAGMIGGGQ